jgi:hypothetical protein
MSEGSDNIDATAKSETTKKKNKNKDAINMDSIKEKPAEKVQTKSLLNSRTEVKKDCCDWKKSGKISQDTFDSLYRDSAYMLSYSQIPPPPTVTNKTNKKSEKKRKTKRSKSYHNETLSQTSQTESAQYQDPPVEQKILTAIITPAKTTEKISAVKDFKSINDSIDSKSSEPRAKLKSAGYPNRKFCNERQGLYENRRTYQSMANVIGPIHKEMYVFFLGLKNVSN